MNICIFGASSSNIDRVYFEKVSELGKKIAERGHSIVFGGGDKGMMGAAARGAHEMGGEIIGVAPKFFDMPGILYEDCTEFIFTETMAERKKIFESKSQGFIVTPGGSGTFEEFFEVLTLKQLGQLKGAIAIYNINGYFDKLLDTLKFAKGEGFVKPITLELFRTFDDADEMLDYIEKDDMPLMDIHITKY